MRGWVFGALALLAVAPGLAQDGRDPVDLESGMASYFGGEMAGNRTANGERCDPETLTAAHRTAPFGALIRVTHILTGRSVVVRINDRGPFRRGLVIDLSYAAARAIGLDRAGTGRVALSLLRD